MTKKTVSIRIDEDLWRKVKVVSAEKNMKISAFAETSLIHGIKKLNGR